MTPPEPMPVARPHRAPALCPSGLLSEVLNDEDKAAHAATPPTAACELKKQVYKYRHLCVHILVGEHVLFECVCKCVCVCERERDRVYLCACVRAFV